MDGHAVQGGGVIVDGGKFDWAASGKFPDFTEPDESYHGVVYTREFGAMAYIIKARMQLMRDFGAIRRRTRRSCSTSVWRPFRCVCASTARTR